MILVIENSFQAAYWMLLFMRIYDVCNHFYGNDETKFSKKLKFS